MCTSDDSNPYHILNRISNRISNPHPNRTCNPYPNRISNPNRIPNRLPNRTPNRILTVSLTVSLTLSSIMLILDAVRLCVYGVGLDAALQKCSLCV